MQQYQSRQLLSPKSPYCPYSATGLTMCNDYGNHIPYDDYLAAFSQTRIPVRWPTAAPNLAPIHDRQMAILNRDDWSAWLDLTRPEAALLKPLPEGSLKIEQVRP